MISVTTYIALLSLCGLISLLMYKYVIHFNTKRNERVAYREKTIAGKAEFDEMIDAVLRYLDDQSPENKSSALEKIALLRFKREEPMNKLLDDLYMQILRSDGAATTSSITIKLSDVTKEERNRRLRH